MIVVSAYADYLAKAYVGGAAQVIRKPFEPENLLNAVLEVLPEQANHAGH